jgi:hypothetical protein
VNTARGLTRKHYTEAKSLPRTNTLAYLALSVSYKEKEFCEIGPSFEKQAETNLNVKKNSNTSLWRRNFSSTCHSVEHFKKPNLPGANPIKLFAAVIHGFL